MHIVTIYAPMIYTALCIMFWLHLYPLQGQVGGGWALEFESFLGIVKWHRVDRQVPFGAQKTREFQGTTPSHLPKRWICTHPKHYAQVCINHRCIGGFMHKSPRGRFQGPYWGGWRSRCIKELVHPASPHYKSYKKSRDNCKVHNMRLQWHDLVWLGCNWKFIWKWKQPKFYRTRSPEA